MRKGATVYLGARSEERAKASIKRIEDEGTGPGNGKALYLHLDLADPPGTKKSAEEFLQKEQRLDVLSASLRPILKFDDSSHALL